VELKVWVMTGLLDALVAERLGCAGGGLFEAAHDGAPGEIDLEAVGRLGLRLPDDAVGRRLETLAGGGLALEQGLGLAVAPGLVGDAAEREARGLHRVAVEFQGRRHRDQREGVGQAVAQLQVGVVLREAALRQVHRDDDLAGGEVGVDLRLVARQPVEVRERDRPVALRPAHLHGGLQGGQRDAHVGGMGGDAVLARPEDRVDAGHPADRRAAGAGLALVAGRGRVVEIIAAGPLEQVAARGGRVAQLRRGAGQDGVAQERVAVRDAVVVGDLGVGGERPDPQAAALVLDLVQRQAGDVDQPARLLDLVLHQVDQVGTAGDEACAVAEGLHRLRHRAGADVIEAVHRAPPCMTSSMASTMLV
jgi:hypothetical protein